NVWGLVFFRWVERRGASDRYTFSFGHGDRGPFVLLFICIFRLVVLSDREGIYQRNLRRRRDCLEEVMNERSELLRRIGKGPLHFTKVDRNLVEENQRRFAPEEFADRVSARRDVLLIALADALIALGPG